MVCGAIAPARHSGLAADRWLTRRRRMGSPASGYGRPTVDTLGLVTASALLVHLAGGVIELHLHFVLVALITLYEEWLLFLLAIRISWCSPYWWACSIAQRRMITVALAHPSKW